QRPPKNLAFEDLPEVLQSDKRVAWIEDAVGADAVVEGKQEWQPDEQHDIKDRGCDEQRSEHLRSVKREARAHQPCWGRFGDHAHRSYPSTLVVRRPSRSK